MVKHAFSQMKTSTKFSHLFPSSLSSVSSLTIDEIHPYQHRHDAEAARKLFPDVKSLFATTEEENKRKYKYDCILLSGSLYNASDREPWSLAEAAWLREIIQESKTNKAHIMPILGICFGHQLLGQELFGGKCENHAEGGEWGSFLIEFTDEAKTDPVLGPLVAFSPKGVWCNITHGQSVRNLPYYKKGTTTTDDGNDTYNRFPLLLGSSKYEPCHLVRYSEHIWGFQPHPEYRVDYLKEDITEIDGEEVASKCTFQKDEDDFSAIMMINFFAYAKSII